MTTKIIKTYENAFNLIEDLFKQGYSVSMLNHRRWNVSMNDNFGMYSDLPFLEVGNFEIRGNKSNYAEYSNLDILCEFLEIILEEINDYYNRTAFFDRSESGIEKFECSKFVDVSFDENTNI